MSNFHVILPSNACPVTHPENTAAKYIVSWENTLNLPDGDWRVALIEANFNRPSATVNANFGIEYDRTRKVHYEFVCSIAPDGLPSKERAMVGWCSPKDFPEPEVPPYDQWKRPKAILDEHRILHLELDHPFSIDFGSSSDAERCGFSNTSLKSVDAGNGLHHIVGDLKVPEVEEGNISVQGVTFYYTSNEFIENLSTHVSEEIALSEKSELMDYLIGNFSDIIQNVSYAVTKTGETTQKLKIQLRNDIRSVRFLNGFNIVLGFRTEKIPVQDGWITADFPVNFHGGISNLYIYTSICEPIQVGDARVPLLKNIWLEQEKEVNRMGETMNISVLHPMYIKLCTSSINNIEIDIRSDSGQLIPFVEESKTSLTLHFKKFN